MLTVWSEASISNEVTLLSELGSNSIYRECGLLGTVTQNLKTVFCVCLRSIYLGSLSPVWTRTDEEWLVDIGVLLQGHIYLPIGSNAFFVLISHDLCTWFLKVTLVSNSNYYWAFPSCWKLLLKREFVLFLTGADNIRKYWSRYYQGSQGVIFVLDSASSEDDLETARNELHSALQHPQLCTLPFLILANHQDKPAARSVQEVRLGNVTSLCPLSVALLLPHWNQKRCLSLGVCWLGCFSTWNFSLLRKCKVHTIW